MIVRIQSFAFVELRPCPEYYIKVMRRNMTVRSLTARCNIFDSLVFEIFVITDHILLEFSGVRRILCAVHKHEFHQVSIVGPQKTLRWQRRQTNLEIAVFEHGITQSNGNYISYVLMNDITWRPRRRQVPAEIATPV